MTKNSGYENYKKLIDELAEKVSTLTVDERTEVTTAAFKSVRKATQTYEDALAKCIDYTREACDIENDFRLGLIPWDEAYRKLLLCKFHAESARIRAEYNYERSLLVGAESLYHRIFGTREVGRKGEAGQRFYGIKTHLESDGIYVKTPICPRKTYYEVRENGRISLADPIFPEYVGAAIMSDSNYDNYDFSRYDKKTIFLLYVYPKEGLSDEIPDIDNHNSKALVNAISDFFDTGDTAFTTSIRAEAVLSDDVEPGTYTTVMPGTSAHIESAKIIQYWQ